MNTRPEDRENRPAETGMDEWEKAQSGFLYDANHDPAILSMRDRVNDLCFAFNQTRPSDEETRRKILGELLPHWNSCVQINAPFYCDYGVNLYFETEVFINYNCFFLDAAPIRLGRFVFIAPGCIFTTAGHPLDVTSRNEGLEIALPITVEDNVWIGAGVTVLPGVTIGEGSVIGAGSVVNRDIPAGVVAAGNPCRVIRPVQPEDAFKYPVYGS